MKPFLIEIQNVWAWADKLGIIILGHLGYFWLPFWYSEPLVRVFYYSAIISTKNWAFISSSKMFMWDWDLNLGRKELGI
jgi:hypothetical protein